MKRKLPLLVGILLLLPILLLSAVAIFIDPIVRSGVEKGASVALKVPARLDRASIRWSGQATLERFEADNPPGFNERRAFAFDRVDLAVTPAALLQDVIRIGEVVIVKPELTLEFIGTRNNLSALMDNLSSGRPSGSGEGKKFLVRKLRIVQGTVRVRSDLLTEGSRSFSLPTLELENVGTAEGGASTAELLQAVLQALAGAAGKAGEGVLPTQLLDSLSSGIRDLPARSMEEIRRRAEELKPKTHPPAKKSAD